MTAWFTALALLSLGLTLWQWQTARRFPLHHRTQPDRALPGVTLLKPLHGCDAETERCLRAWLHQDYDGPVQILFGVASAQDPVCPLVGRLLAEHPGANAALVVCPAQHGTNPKVSTLVELEARSRHELLIVSDADVLAPADLLQQLVSQLTREGLALTSCLYTMANPANLAMRLEAVAVNADFWAQVLQARTLWPLDFALGAVMATTRQQVRRAGGFLALANRLADDHELGRRLAQLGARIGLSPVVVECRSAPLTWRQVVARQLRWARTIRACRPASYFLSILGNPTLWPLLLLAHAHAVAAFQGLDSGPLSELSTPGGTAIWAWLIVLVCLTVRLASAAHTQRLLTQRRVPTASLWLTPLKDLLQVPLWLAAFAGNRVTWGESEFVLGRAGTLRPTKRRSLQRSWPGGARSGGLL